jgi:hypothetical protein
MTMFLTQGGKLLMVNSVLSSFPSFFMSAVKVPVGILNKIDRHRRHCHWGGAECQETTSTRMEAGLQA